MNALVDARQAVVVPNWNGASELRQCLDSLIGQSLAATIIVVDNGSTDSSVEIIEAEYPNAILIKHTVNKGYAGGVNPGFRWAIEHGYDFVAPFNNDAIADKHWLRRLVETLDTRPEYGIAACKLLSEDGKHLDSAGDYYTIWGLPYPRGRNEVTIDKYDGPEHREIFGASGGASLYRVDMLREIGLLDEDFFAYYEDVDISFRAQLAGWKIIYVPESLAYHATSTTGAKIKGFFTEQTMKNLPMLLWKNVPRKLLLKVIPRFTLAYLLFFGRAIQRHQLSYALRGMGRAFLYWPRKHAQRRAIQSNRAVSDDYIAGILTYDLPPNATKLRAFRRLFFRSNTNHQIDVTNTTRKAGKR